MKILIINSLDAGHGSTYRARALWSTLKDLGYDCIYVESNYMTKNGKNDVISVKQSNNSLSFLLSSIKRAYLCLTLKYDVCVIQKVLPLTILSIIVVKFIKKKKLIVDWDDFDVDFQSSKFRELSVKFCEYIFFLSPPFTITHSKVIESYLRGKGVDNIYLVPQPVDESIFSPSKFNIITVKKELGLEDMFVVGYVVTFTNGGIKDIDKVLKMYKEITNKKSKSLLLIIGGGLLEQKVITCLKQYNIENYMITGLIPQDKVAYYISACDLCLIYMTDCLGNIGRVSFKLLEYISMQKPVIGKVVGETKDILGDYVVDINSALKQDFIFPKEESINLVKRKYSMSAFKESLKEVMKRCLK